MNRAATLRSSGPGLSKSGRNSFIVPLLVLTEFDGDAAHQADNTTLGGVRIPAGTVLMLCLGAANRDPRKFANPNEFQIDRKNVREHIAFGRGIHTCAGAPLARVEGHATINRLLDRTHDITISRAEHGPPANRRYAYTPTFLLRGLSAMHIEFTPAD